MLITPTLLIDFWNNEGGKNISLTNEIKDFFLSPLKLNIVLNHHYVPSELNFSYLPSRFYSDLDCSLADATWALVDSLFGPHSFDLMALPSNVRKSRDGSTLKFFSPLPVQGSSGGNVFADNLSH